MAAESFLRCATPVDLSAAEVAGFLGFRKGFLKGFLKGLLRV